MILYVVTDTLEQYQKQYAWHSHRNRLEETAGDACLMLHYTQATKDNVAKITPWAICHSGGGTFYDEYDVLKHRDYQAMVRDTDVAQIGFCGGHQILAHYFGSRIGIRPMRRLRANEVDLNPWVPGLFREWGVYPVRILRQDPLFRGCAKVIRVQEYHCCEVQALGKGLIHLASSRTCRIQAFRHRTRPVYGTQFHPEQSPPAYPDGTQVLENFFRLARAYHPADVKRATSRGR